MYSRVSSMLRGSGRMIQRAATTTGSLPLSKSLLGTLLKRVSVSRRKVASFLAGTRHRSGHLTEFCRKCSLCFRSTAVSWSGNPAFSIKEIPRDSCSSTRLGTHRYSGDDSQSSRGTQANTLTPNRNFARWQTLSMALQRKPRQGGAKVVGNERVGPYQSHPFSFCRNRDKWLVAGFGELSGRFRPVPGVEDFEVAEATYRATVKRWPNAVITLRQSARVIH